MKINGVVHVLSCRDEAVSHALHVRQALQLDNYHRFFKLYRDTSEPILRLEAGEPEPVIYINGEAASGALTGPDSVTGEWTFVPTQPLIDGRTYNVTIETESVEGDTQRSSPSIFTVISRVFPIK